LHASSIATASTSLAVVWASAVPLSRRARAIANAIAAVNWRRKERSTNVMQGLLSLVSAGPKPDVVKFRRWDSRQRYGVF
jgi:hypothetical protein